MPAWLGLSSRLTCPRLVPPARGRGGRGSISAPPAGTGLSSRGGGALGKPGGSWGGRHRLRRGAWCSPLGWGAGATSAACLTLLFLLPSSLSGVGPACSRRAGKLPRPAPGAAFGRGDGAAPGSPTAAAASAAGPDAPLPRAGSRSRSPPRTPGDVPAGGFSQLLQGCRRGLFTRGGNQTPCTAARPAPRRAGRGGGGDPLRHAAGEPGRGTFPPPGLGCSLPDSAPNLWLPTNKAPRHRRSVWFIRTGLGVPKPGAGG